MNPIDPTGRPTDDVPPPSPELAPPLLTHHELLNYLFRHGHFHQVDEQGFRTGTVVWHDLVDLPPEHPSVHRAIESWQTMRPGLAVDGAFGPKSYARSAAERALRCGLPDVMQRGTASSRWPNACKHELTTKHTLDGLTYIPDTEKTINQAWDKGLHLWNQTADLTLSRQDPNVACRIRANSRQLSRNILAWSELAYDDCSATLDQAYNNQVRWHWHLLWSTICHEIGHALGLAHGGRGIMQPAHDSTVHALGAWDRKQVIDRYGARTPPDPPADVDDVAVHHAVLELFDREGMSVARFDITARAED